MRETRRTKRVVTGVDQSPRALLYTFGFSVDSIFTSW